MAAGFDVVSLNHAEAVMDRDFPGPLFELQEILTTFEIYDTDLIRGGGGESIVTQRLRHAFAGRAWNKKKIVIKKIVNDVERAATTHEIDHVRRTENGSLALEIEWNNKDPFFDRDLENFQRLHLEGVISVGIIVTRGRSLQLNMRRIVSEFGKNRNIQSFTDLAQIGIHLTQRQTRLVENSNGVFVEEWARIFVSDKFGSSTTHWEKLQVRIQRGVGNPCPLILIGIPSELVQCTHGID